MPLSRRTRRRPWLSIIVVAFEMAREIPRTVQSLVRPYQRAIDDLTYEVLVIDHGSPTPLDADSVQRIAPEVRCVRFSSDIPSPAPAVNRGVEMTTGEHICVVLDGARMVTPGVLAHARRALRWGEDTLVAVLNWHLGPGMQQQSAQAGYSAAAEDQLLDSIGWPADGYRLFEIASLAGSNLGGWFGPLFETGALFVNRRHFDRVGGYDERFTTAGGGLVNLEFFGRASAASRVVTLLGEGTFHQIHGGASTSADEFGELLQTYGAEYERLLGRPWRPPKNNPIYVGRMPPQARRFILDEKVPS